MWVFRGDNSGTVDGERYVEGGILKSDLPIDTSTTWQLEKLPESNRRMVKKDTVLTISEC